MQENSSYTVIGLMSGTSGDGLDIAHCLFQRDKEWNFEITHTSTVPFPKELGEKLNAAHLLSAEELEELDLSFGKWMGGAARQFCSQHQLNPAFIASHGHTVFHRPEKKLTKQIGSGHNLSLAAGLPVVNDFRKLDVALGGQGAPLVPVGDALLFGQYDYALNLGGIANISLEKNNSRVAYDTCPFNLLFNHLALKLGKAYDTGGQWASEGKIIPSLLEALESLPFYLKSGAKSLAREDLEQAYLPLLAKPEMDVKDALATLSEHFAIQISRPMLQNANPDSGERKLLVTGGGAYNHFFIEKLSSKLKGQVNVILPEATIIEFKEALVFAFLGVLRVRSENNCLASVTGAERDNCGGTLFGFNEKMKRP